MSEYQDETAWCLEGHLDGSGKVWRTFVRPLPFRVGRRPDFDLTLASKRVSQTHAEFFSVGQGSLWVRDLGSTNGTFVNGDRLQSAQQLEEGDQIHFAELEFRLLRVQQEHQTSGASKTMALRYSDLPVPLLDRARQFRAMLREDTVDTAFQPLVRLDDRGVVGYEILGRGRLGGVEIAPNELFQLAADLSLEEKLSAAFRNRGLQLARSLPGKPLIFFNAHPQELANDHRLLADLSTFRKREPDLKMVLEVHESAVTDIEALRGLCRELEQLDIGVAFDDFGTGQARLVELSHVAPSFLKFDAIWIRGLDRTDFRRRDMVRTLVNMVVKMGTVAVAEGIETAEEAEACLELGFEYGQGFFFGRPQKLDYYV